MPREAPQYIVDDETRLKIAGLNKALEYLEPRYRSLVEKQRAKKISDEEKNELEVIRTAIPRIQNAVKQLTPSLGELMAELAKTKYKDWTP